MPLSISILLGSPTPVYRQIVDQIGDAVVAGRLVEGEVLPGIRDLAEELRLNHNTVARAYLELAREGIIETRGSQGSVVKAPRKLTRSERCRRIDPALQAYVSEALRLGFTKEEILEDVEARADKLSPAPSRKPRGGSR